MSSQKIMISMGVYITACILAEQIAKLVPDGKGVLVGFIMGGLAVIVRDLITEEA